MGWFDWLKSDLEKEMDQSVAASIAKFADEMPWHVEDETGRVVQTCANWEEANAAARNLNDGLPTPRYVQRITQ